MSCSSKLMLSQSQARTQCPSVFVSFHITTGFSNTLIAIYRQLEAGAVTGANGEGSRFEEIDSSGTPEARGDEPVTADGMHAKISALSEKQVDDFDRSESRGAKLDLSDTRGIDTDLSKAHGVERENETGTRESRGNKTGAQKARRNESGIPIASGNKNIPPTRSENEGFSASIANQSFIYY